MSDRDDYSFDDGPTVAPEEAAANVRAAVAATPPEHPDYQKLVPEEVLTAAEYHEQRFRACTPRSGAYKQGFLFGLKVALGETKIGGLHLFEWGTAECDAWWAAADAAKTYLKVSATRNKALEKHLVEVRIASRKEVA